MKILLTISIVLYAWNYTFSGIESLPAENKTTVYVKMDYMSLANSTPRKYFELELGIWRRIHEERIRQGVTTAWYLYSVVPGDGSVPDLPYDYITVSVFNDYDMVFDDMATEAIRIAYSGIDLDELYAKSDEARVFVRSDLWKMVDVVSPYTDSKPVSEYISVNYFDSRDHSGEHMELETGFWAGIHEERIRRGNLNSEAVFLLANNGRAEQNYNYATIDYYDNLMQIRQPIDVALASSAHPDLTEEEIRNYFARTPEARSVFKSELWRLVDYIDSVED
jgi:hypothetical protein